MTTATEVDHSTRKPTAFDADLGARLRELRIAARLSQERLAEKIGVTFQQVQKYERGVNRVSVHTLTKIAAALEVSPAEIIKDASNHEGRTSPGALLAQTREGQDAINALLDLNPRQVALVASVARAMNGGTEHGND